MSKHGELLNQTEIKPLTKPKPADIEADLLQTLKASQKLAASSHTAGDD
jgi:hypothetical protein